MLKAEWFNLRNENDFNKYYPIVYQWWIDWKWSPINPEMLPQNGIIIKDLETNKYIFAGWLWLTDSKMCIIDLIISTRDKGTKNIRKQAFKNLMEQLENIGKKLGFEAIFTCAKNQVLINKLLSLGYGLGSKGGLGDRNITSFIKKI